jgi:hypothetical protein
MSIKAFVEKVLADKSRNLQKIELGKVTDAEIEFLKETVSLDLTDYCRVLDNLGICHAFKKHGDAKIEAQRGQIAITPDDFENILELVQNPDFVAYVGKNRIGNDLILYEKTFEEVLCYVERLRESKKKHRKEVYLETLYKKKPSKE